MRTTTVLIDGDVEWLQGFARESLRVSRNDPQAEFDPNIDVILARRHLTPEVNARRAASLRQRFIDDPSLRAQASVQIKARLAKMTPEAKAQKSQRQREYHADPVQRARLGAKVKAVIAAQTPEQKRERHRKIGETQSAKSWTPERRAAQRALMIAFNSKRSKINQ